MGLFKTVISDARSSRRGAAPARAPASQTGHRPHSGRNKSNPMDPGPNLTRPVTGGGLQRETAASPATPLAQGRSLPLSHQRIPGPAAPVGTNPGPQPAAPKVAASVARMHDRQTGHPVTLRDQRSGPVKPGTGHSHDKPRQSDAPVFQATEQRTESTPPAQSHDRGKPSSRNRSDNGLTSNRNKSITPPIDPNSGTPVLARTPDEPQSPAGKKTRAIDPEGKLHLPPLSKEPATAVNTPPVIQPVQSSSGEKKDNGAVPGEAVDRQPVRQHWAGQQEDLPSGPLNTEPVSPLERLKTSQDSLAPPPAQPIAQALPIAPESPFSHQTMDERSSGEPATTPQTATLLDTSGHSERHDQTRAGEQQEEWRASTENPAGTLEAASAAINDRLAGLPAEKQESAGPPAFQAPAPPEVKIGRIDVFVEKSSPSPSNAGGSARPSVAMASRHYLRRL